MFKCLLASTLLLFCVSSFADDAMVDLPNQEDIVSMVQFTGQPGFNSSALIVRSNGEELSLLIIQQPFNDARNYLIIDNNKLGLVAGGSLGTESSVDVNKVGSLLIKQQNQSVGRSRFERTLTVAYRDGKYSVVGYTYSSYDTLQEEEPENCDYNLIKRRGIKNGKNVLINTPAFDLETAVDTEKMYTCEGW